MDWSMTVPCGDCPFRKAGGIKLTRGRIREIGGMMLDSQGGTFPCHRTVDYSEADEDRDTGEEIHCAGALIFAEKHDTATQMMRIMERLQIYDYRRFTEEHKALVWDSLRQWLRNGTFIRGANCG